MTKRLEGAYSAGKTLILAAWFLYLGAPIVASLWAPLRLRAQSPVDTGKRPAFEVASIKPSKSDRQGTFLRRQPGGLYTATYVSVRSLIASAYLNEFPPEGRTIFGGPGWIDSEHFDIEARAAGDPEKEEERLMLQSLLEDRFMLVLHHETRQLPIYALVVAKSGKRGSHLMVHSGDAKCTDPSAGRPLPQPNPGEAMPAYCGGFYMSRQPGELRETGNGITMDMLVPFLSQSVDREVVNRTGLGGVFDFTLDFAPELGPGSRPALTAGATDQSAPSIFTALQDQLGLKLESQKGPVEVLVIDHIEQPSEN